MSKKEIRYYSFKEILEFLGFKRRFEDKNKKYPFNRGKEDVTFSWGQVLIPKYGIRKMVENKISNIDDAPLEEIKMMYQIPFSTDNGIGVINKNISLSFRYDKQYKYGTINKSIYECCFWILENAKRTNDFYIITDDLIQDFFSCCVMNNQWGLGSMSISSPPAEKL